MSTYSPTIVKNNLIKELRQRILVLEGSRPACLLQAERNIDGASMQKLMASGIVMRFEHLDGKPIIDPVVIPDGLSEETIGALKLDFKRGAVFYSCPAHYLK
jgi:hypothetical protein